MYTKDLVFKSRAGLLTFESLQLDKRLGKVLYYNKLQFLSIQKWLSTYILIDKKMWNYFAQCEYISWNWSTSSIESSFDVIFAENFNCGNLPSPSFRQYYVKSAYLLLNHTVNHFHEIFQSGTNVRVKFLIFPLDGK